MVQKKGDIEAYKKGRLMLDRQAFINLTIEERLEVFFDYLDSPYFIPKHRSKQGFVLTKEGKEES